MLLRFYIINMVKIGLVVFEKKLLSDDVRATREADRSIAKDSADLKHKLYIFENVSKCHLYLKINCMRYIEHLYIVYFSDGMV